MTTPRVSSQESPGNAESKHAGSGGSGGDPTQEAAKLARSYVPRAIEVVGEILEKPGRGAQSQLSAAKMLLELAGQLKPEETRSAAVVKLVDAKAAAEELQRRLQSK